MRKGGDKVLLGFLALGIFVYLLALRYDGDSAADSNADAPGVGTNMLLASSPADAAMLAEGGISLASYSLKAETATHWKLPGRLEEISGLAMTRDHRLLAHNDEAGVIYELDYRRGSILKTFALTDMVKPVADDFEGIAAVEDRIYLATSSGRLYECREGTAGQSVLFNVYTTGIGRDCEIEALAYDAEERMLLLMCKNSRGAARQNQLTIYRWSIDAKELSEGAHTVIPVVDFARHLKGKKFQPSGIELHPASGNYFVVAARQQAIAELTPAGQVLAVRRFSAPWHRQVEGITFAADSALIVADEGAGKKARLTLYPVAAGAQ